MWTSRTWLEVSRNNAHVHILAGLGSVNYPIPHAIAEKESDNGPEFKQSRSDVLGCGLVDLFRRHPTGSRMLAAGVRASMITPLH